MANNKEVLAQEVLVGLSMLQAHLNKDISMMNDFDATYTLEEQRSAMLTSLGAVLGALHGSLDNVGSRDDVIDYMRNVAFQMMSS
jgi:hypothetical protein